MNPSTHSQLLQPAGRDRSRPGTEAVIGDTQPDGARLDTNDLFENIKAVAIVGAAILALRLYAAIAAASVS